MVTTNHKHTGLIGSSMSRVNRDVVQLWDAFPLRETRLIPGSSFRAVRLHSCSGRGGWSCKLFSVRSSEGHGDSQTVR
jgi:hypothetical protein